MVLGMRRERWVTLTPGREAVPMRRERELHLSERLPR